MIQQSFIFLDGIGYKTEQNIWLQGINSWDSFLNAKNIRGISKRRKKYYDRQLLKAKYELYRFNSEYTKKKITPYDSAEDKKELSFSGT